jgi:hypothetical protein
MVRKKKDYGKIINKIEKIRGKNNTTWMNIVRIAFKHAPKETARVISKIYLYDQKISDLVKKLN